MRVGIDPKVDYAFKWVFGRPSSSPILIDAIHAVLNPPPGERITEVHILNPFSEKIAMDDKLSILDIKARDQKGRRFNVEMQMVGYPSLPQRILFYWSKLYTEQLQPGEDYHLLRPTISVCFVDGTLFPQVSDYHTSFRLMESKHGITLNEDLQMRFLELPKFAKPVSELTTPLDGWLYFLKHAEELDPGELPGSMDRLEIRQAMEALTMLEQTDMQKEIYEGRLKAQRDERARLFHAQTEGYDKGELAGRITMIQQFLGQEPIPRPELRSMSMEDLQRMADELQQQWGR